MIRPDAASVGGSSSFAQEVWLISVLKSEPRRWFDQFVDRHRQTTISCVLACLSAGLLFKGLCINCNLMRYCRPYPVGPRKKEENIEILTCRKRCQLSGNWILPTCDGTLRASYGVLTIHATNVERPRPTVFGSCRLPTSSFLLFEMNGPWSTLTN